VVIILQVEKKKKKRRRRRPSEVGPFSPFLKKVRAILFLKKKEQRATEA
jgi:hypothetical protein